MPTYYKVVTKIPDNKYVSAIVSGKARVEYKIGKYAMSPEWLLKNGYGLLVFDTIRNAKIFKGHNDKLFTCKCINKLPLKKRLSFIILRKGLDIFSSEQKGNFPEGSLMFEKVMLLEEIKDD